MEGKIKVICPNCNKTDNYKIKPNYCAHCGFEFQNQGIHKMLISNHNKDNI